MPERYHAGLTLIAILVASSALAQVDVRETPLQADQIIEALPAVPAGSPLVAVERAREDVAAAAAALMEAARSGNDAAVTAAYQSALSARRMMETAITSARAEDLVQDALSDRLNRAIDEIGQVTDVLQHGDTALNEITLDVALGRLEDVATTLDDAAENLNQRAEP